MPDPKSEAEPDLRAGRKLAIREDSPWYPADVLVMPASAEKLDRTLVDRAVSHICDLLQNTVSRGMDQIGSFVLHEFYGGSSELYFGSNSNKHVSLRTLVECCNTLELPVSRTFLCNAIRMAAIKKGLPQTAAFHRLPPSHRVELLRVGAPGRVEWFATRAVEDNLSVQRLRALIHSEQVESGPRRGRRRRPDVVKAIEACLRVVRDHETGRLSISQGDVENMSSEDRARAQAGLATLEKQIGELRRILG